MLNYFHGREFSSYFLRSAILDANLTRWL